MTTFATADWAALDLTPDADKVTAEVVAGLSGSPKTLPCKLFYDRRGSDLFDRICEQPEYYPTRTEIGIMQRHAADMADRLGPGVRLIELGSGSSAKTPLLIEKLDRPACYVPVEISGAALQAACDRLGEAFPGLPIQPVVADYTHRFATPEPPSTPRRDVAYFPGSTIGNFHRDEARGFLKEVAAQVGPGGGMLIGVDLRKPADVLRPAYDDAAGVTAAFNRNALTHINRVADADFNLDGFDHRAVWNDEHGRVEMHLVANRPQRVRIDGHAFDFAEGEPIWTESSYKHTLEGFAELVDGVFHVFDVWTDDRSWFSVQYLEARR